jgi:polynucleotide kinase-phosphatase
MEGLKLPEFCIVSLIGVSNSGKTTFAKKHFKSTEILSSDYFRSLVSDDENNQSVTEDAFQLLYQVAEKRLKNKKFTVVDATNVTSEARKEALCLAKTYHCFAVAIVLNIPDQIAVERNSVRSDRNFSPGVIYKQSQNLKRSLKKIKYEGFRYVYVINSVEELSKVTFKRERLWTNKENVEGPFDIIGDVHGCFDELKELLVKLGYQVNDTLIGTSNSAVKPPANRKVIFLADLVDRGPYSPEVLSLVMNMVKGGQAYCVAGNHDIKLVKYLSNKKAQLTHGLKETAEQLEGKSDEFKKEIRDFLDGLISHYVFDKGNLVVAHAGLKEELQGRSSGAVREFSLYGETTGEADEYGLPIRSNWAKDYRGKALVVYGHTPVVEPEFYNNTICIDTGCVFGGKLTALRYPEKELVSVDAHKVYYEPIRPLLASPTPEQSSLTLKLEDVLGKRRIETKLHGNIRIESKNASAALEVMSRYSIDPRWLIYLPATMSPTDVNHLKANLEKNKTTQVDEKDYYLEYPSDAIEYFKKHGVQKLIMQEKHMGSRAILVVCKNSDVPYKRFKIQSSTCGVIYTRTGRPFFEDPRLENEVINLIQKSLAEIGFWEKFNSDWVCLDAEIMPWSFKALELLKSQYAAVGSAANLALSKTQESLNLFNQRNIGTDPTFQGFIKKIKSAPSMISAYVDSYQRYCWPFNSINDIKIAPFHILATEGVSHFDKDHLWHMNEIQNICESNLQLFKLTGFKLINTLDESSIGEAISWWLQSTEAGSEGVVIKSLNFIEKVNGKLIQPMIKCRGRDYLRIIYGPTYLRLEELEKLQNRYLGTKRKLALEEFALGVESLKRFVKNEPLHKIHEAVFGVLALESEPVDPRL